MEKILITGACGQLGTELTNTLREIHGNGRVIATDIKEPGGEQEGPFEKLDVLDRERLAEIAGKYEITQVYHLAAMLSAKAEEHIKSGWKLNMEGLLNVLELAKEKGLNKVYWPSSIAVFGPDAPAESTPQNTPLNPTTVYGISKVAGEHWCSYYHSKFGVDVRSLRYPGLIGYKSLPGGGTTDYAVDIFHKALTDGSYTCFLEKDTMLPMMYMKDAVRATIELMQAESANIEIRTSYNIAAISFTPEEIANSIRDLLPEFSIRYEPDYRQKIADSWPDIIDDRPAREQWGWQQEFDLGSMTRDMLKQLPQYWDLNPDKFQVSNDQPSN